MDIMKQIQLHKRRYAIGLDELLPAVVAFVLIAINLISFKNMEEDLGKSPHLPKRRDLTKRTYCFK